MNVRYRVIVEWWNAELQRTEVVYRRVFKTHRGAERAARTFTVHRVFNDEYRASITPFYLEAAPQ